MWVDGVEKGRDEKEDKNGEQGIAVGEEGVKGKELKIQFVRAAD